MDTVSIILPVYNCEKYLKHTIQSVLNQNYKKWELLIIDDCSTDNSLREALKFAEKDKRIKVYQNPTNIGVGAARNAAIKHAKGRYLAFIDSDDLWSRHKLYRQLVFMKKNKAALSHTGSAFINMKGKIRFYGKNVVDHKIDLATYMKTTQIGMSTVMIDRNVIKSVHFPEDRKLCEDASLWMQYLRNGHNFYGLNQTLMLYRVRDNQLSGNKVKMALNTLNRYLHEKNLPAYKRLYYFMHYAYNGIKKRTTRKNINISAFHEDFNYNRKNEGR